MIRKEPTVHLQFSWTMKKGTLRRKRKQPTAKPPRGIPKPLPLNKLSMKANTENQTMQKCKFMLLGLSVSVKHEATLKSSLASFFTELRSAMVSGEAQRRLGRQNGMFFEFWGKMWRGCSTVLSPISKGDTILISSVIIQRRTMVKAEVG